MLAPRHLFASLIALELTWFEYDLVGNTKRGSLRQIPRGQGCFVTVTSREALSTLPSGICSISGPTARQCWTADPRKTVEQANEGAVVKCDDDGRRRLHPLILMINSLARIPSWIATHWKSGVVVAGFVGIAATCRWCLETDEVRDQRAQRRNKKEFRALADRISTYGRNVHRRYPTGDVVVSECDLAGQLRKVPRFCCHSTQSSLANKKSNGLP